MSNMYRNSSYSSHQYEGNYVKGSSLGQNHYYDSKYTNCYGGYEPCYCPPAPCPPAPCPPPPCPPPPCPPAPCCNKDVSIDKQLSAAMCRHYYAANVRVGDPAVDGRQYAYVGIENPINSCVNIYIDSISIINYMCRFDLEVEVFLNPSPINDNRKQLSTKGVPTKLGNGVLPHLAHLSEGNLIYNISMAEANKFTNGFEDTTKQPPSIGDSVSILSKFCDAGESITIEEGGVIILTPGTYFAIMLIGLENGPNGCPAKAKVSINWWEERPC